MFLITVKILIKAKPQINTEPLRCSFMFWWIIAGLNQTPSVFYKFVWVAHSSKFLSCFDLVHRNIKLLSAQTCCTSLGWLDSPQFSCLLNFMETMSSKVWFFFRSIGVVNKRNERVMNPYFWSCPKVWTRVHLWIISNPSAHKGSPIRRIKTVFWKMN